MTKLSREQQIQYEEAVSCYDCEKRLEDERVANHCHLTGAYRGACHPSCNLKFKIPKILPVFYHNLFGSDAHLFIKDLAVEYEDIDVIAQTMENLYSLARALMSARILIKMVGNMLYLLNYVLTIHYGLWRARLKNKPII